MKRMIGLIVATVAALAIIAALAWLTPRTAVTAVTVQPQDIEETVICRGKVQAAEQTEICVGCPCLVHAVKIKPGQTVAAGDPLLTVDTAASAAVLEGQGLSAASLTPTVAAVADGTVLSVSASAGDWLDPNEPFAVIQSNTGPCIVLSVSENRLARVAVGQSVTVSGAAFAKDSYRGTVAAIADSAHTAINGSAADTVVDVTVQLNPEDGDLSLREGLTARAAITVAQQKQVLLISYDCLTQDEEGHDYVYVLENDGRAHRRFLTLGTETADGVLVVSGLADGDRVVRHPEALSGDCPRVRTA